MAIVDGRTVVDTAEALTNWVNDAGAAFGGSVNTDTFIKGSGSIAERVSNTTLGFFVDLGAATDVSDNTFYFWYNVSTAGLLDTLANGGVRMRFCGATITDWFEVYLAGKDTYSGGWTMAVVNIDEARTAAVATDPNTGTNGTVPAASAIRYVGIFFDMASMVSGNVDNCFVDHAWRLPAATPGIRVEGLNSTVPWTWQDIVDAADPGDTTKAWGTAARRDGVVFINTPIQFGTDDASNADDQFEDTNEVVYFEDARVKDGFYNIEILGASGATADQLFRLGSRSGTGATSTGNQGGVIGAPSTGFAPKWNLTAFDSEIVLTELLGVTMINANIIDASNNNVEIRSCQLGNTSEVIQSGTLGGGTGAADFSKNIIFGADTIDGEALVKTSDMTDIVDCAFTFSDGHAIEITGSTTPQANSGNQFNGYTNSAGSNDAAILNATTIAVVINSSGGSNLGTSSYRNSDSGTTTINNNISVTLTGMKDNTEVRVYNQANPPVEQAGIENATAGTADDRSFTFSLAASTVVDIAIFNIDRILPPNNRIESYTIPNADTSIPISQITDRNYTNP